MKLFLLLAAASACVAASPLKDPLICGSPKCQGSEKFQYAVGTSYRYQYVVDVRTLFEGTSTNQSTLHVEAEVELKFSTPCEGTLKVGRVSLSEQSTSEGEYDDAEYSVQELAESAAFGKAIAQHDLRFGFEDGIVSELCPEDSELSWVLNFKRGILSAFHNSMKRFDIDFKGMEEDVNGQCATMYQLSGASKTSLKIQKSKDLTTCSARYKHHTVLQTTPYIFHSNYQAPPVMRSSSRCHLTVDHNVYTSVGCEERHVFRPFSGAASGATTVTAQSLTLFAENNATASDDDDDPGVVTRRTSLLFDHDLTPKPTTGELKASRDLVKVMCRLSTDDIQRDFPNVFTQFIHTARLLSSQALTQLFSRANSICRSGRKHVTDALPLLGSNAAVAVMMDLVQKGRVSEETERDWLFLVSFLPR
ncbi:vitellogenin-like [Bacillus rossius redtenbacheri]|uniref:vitellogenin-like n=1 Tax=Bacillus rossius redtenbacheri TaxID=93214 RepID=UPI002FDDA9B6